MANKEILFTDLAHFTPKQLEATELVKKFKYVLYGGAKGGGKSYWLRWILLALLLKHARDGKRGVRVGLFCEDYPALKDRQITKIATEFPNWLGTLADSSIEGMSFKLFPKYGSGVLALRNLDDPSKYASSEFADIGIDELTKNPRDKFDQLRSIVRWPGIELNHILGGSNPGGIGHEWVKRLFIDRQFTLEDPPKEQVQFIRSLPTDNPHNAQTYIEELKRLPEKLRKAYAEGNWDVFEGQYFTEWNRDMHVVFPFQIPSFWKRFRSYDHGRFAPACCKWYALDGDGRLWAYRELYETGLNVDQLSDKINKMSEGETYEYSVADPSIFANTGMVDKYGGQTIAESFIRRGVTFIPASNRRVDGWNLMHQYLGYREGTEPKLKYFNNCVNSIRTIPSMIHDEHKPEDLDTDTEDHAADTDRYILLSLHETSTPKPLNEIEKKLLARQQQENDLTKFYLGELHRNAS